MASGDVEVVRGIYERFNRGDYEGSTALLHDQVELHQAPEIPGADTWIGKTEFQRGLADWLSGFERGFQYEVLELIDCDRCVLARLMLHGKGRGSGAEIERQIFNVWEVRDGLGFRCRAFWDEEEARSAAGLEGE
jgi:ketosteroid isomerase-like protein